MEIRGEGASDVGKVREINEDAFCVDAATGLFAVADGMGGHAAGEVAARLALEALHESVKRGLGSERPMLEVLREGVEAASSAVEREATEDAAKSNMGTTLTALWVRDGRAAVAHIGDSRLYRVRWGVVAQLTEDHTGAQEMVRMGAIKPEAAKGHPFANVLSRVIAKGHKDEPQVLELDLAPGDRFLLCSDGFSQALEDPSWLTSLSAADDVSETAARLVARAVELDGTDNATAVVVAVGDEARREERRNSWERLRAAFAKVTGG